MEDTIYIEDLLKYYFKRVIIVILISIAFFELGDVYSEKSHREYYSESTSIMLGSNDENEGSANINTNSGFISNYLLLLDSNKLTTNVINELGIDYSVSRLKSMVNFYEKSNSQMLVITATSDDDELAAKIVNAYVNELRREVESLYHVNNIVVIDEATPSGNLIISENNKSILFTAVGFVLSSAVIILAFLFNENTRIMMRHEPILDVDLLSVFSYGKKDNIYKLRNKNINKFQKILRIIYKINKSKDIKSIMISGNSKYSINFAVNLSSLFKNKKILIIDCKSKNSFSDGVSDGLLDLVVSPANTYNSRLKKYVIHDDETNIDILPIGNLEKNDIYTLSSPKLANLMTKIYENYDIIVVNVNAINSSYEAEMMLDYCDVTIATMIKNKITKESIQNIKKVLEGTNNRLIAIAPLKKKVMKK